MQKTIDLVAIAQAVIYPEDSEAMTLEYFVRQMAGSDQESLYGLRVDKRNPTGALVEREETPALSASSESVTKVAKVFAKGTVPPCTLIEMVDEWFDKLAG